MPKKSVYLIETAEQPAWVRARRSGNKAVAAMPDLRIIAFYIAPDEAYMGAGDGTVRIYTLESLVLNPGL